MRNWSRLGGGSLLAALMALASLRPTPAQAVPAFAITSADLQRALATVGMKLIVCNGEANPSGVANCLSQAEAQNMAGVAWH